jgi:fibronectin-binding autotransporter adhesin
VMTGDRTVNSLALVVNGKTDVDLGGFTLNLASGGLIASQAFVTSGDVSVVSSSTTSSVVELASVPAQLVPGSQLLGSTVVSVNGLTVTLTSNANASITSPSNREYRSALEMPVTITNGNLTAGGVPNTPADLYLHALNYINGQAADREPLNRDLLVGANIMNNGVGAVTLVINGTEGRSTSRFATNEVILTGNNTYTGGTFVNAGYVVLNSPGQALGTGDVTITGGASTNGNTFQERTSTVAYRASSQISSTANLTLNGGAVLDLNGFTQALNNLVFNNTGGHTPLLSVGAGTLSINGDINATSSNTGSVSTLSTGLMTGGLTNGSNVVSVGSTAGLAVGSVVTGSGIAAGTIVASVLNGTQIQLSSNATTTANNVLTFANAGVINMAPGTRTLNVAPVMFNGVDLSPVTPTLDISGNLAGVGSVILKTGQGLLQLGGQNTFDGGVNLSTGGYSIRCQQCQPIRVRSASSAAALWELGR